MKIYFKYNKNFTDASLKVLAEIDVGSGPRAFGQFLSE